MDHLTLERERGRPRQRNTAAKRAFQDLLLEAYREREALLRGKVTLIPEHHERPQVEVNRPPGPAADAPAPAQLRWIETAQAVARVSAVESANDRGRHRPTIEVVRDHVQTRPVDRDNPTLRLPPGRNAVLPPEIAHACKIGRHRHGETPRGRGTQRRRGFLPAAGEGERSRPRSAAAVAPRRRFHRDLRRRAGLLDGRHHHVERGDRIGPIRRRWQRQEDSTPDRRRRQPVAGARRR